MSKPNTKTPAISAEEREARKELADRIANANAIRNSLNNANAAAQMAAEKSWDAADRLNKAKQASEGPSPDALLAAIAAGDIMTHVRAENAAREAVEQLEAEVDVWRNARETALEQARKHEESLMYAEMRVRDAADAVLRFSPQAEDLLEGLEELHSEVTRRRVALDFLRGNGLLPADLEERVKAILYAMAAGPHWGRNEVVTDISAKRAALRENANASL